MKPVQTRDGIAAELLAFIRGSFLSGDPEGELDEHTPLLEYGILNSLNTALLIAYMRDELGITLPLMEVTAATFKSVNSISSMLYERRRQS